MKGNITITALEKGISVSTKLEHVGFMDKLHILHAISKALEMDSADIRLFAFTETNVAALFEDKKVPDEG